MNKRTRFVVVILVLIISAWFLYPTVAWYSGYKISDIDKENATKTKLEVKEYANREADVAWKEFAEEHLEALKAVKGEADVENEEKSVVSKKYNFLIKKAKKNLDLKDVDYNSELTHNDIRVAYANNFELLKEDFINLYTDEVIKRIADVRKLRGKAIKLGLDLSGGMSFMLKADYEKTKNEDGQEVDAKVTESDDPVKDAIEILTNRIDTYGVSEPSIRQIGDDLILVELPGDRDKDKINKFLMGKGKLNFHIVDDEQTTNFINWVSTRYSASNMFDPMSDFDQKAAKRAGVVKVGYTVRGSYSKDKYGDDILDSYLVIEEKIGLFGKRLTDASVGRDNIGGITVNFRLDSAGSEEFRVLTGSNVGKRMAILLDEKVKSAPRIENAIAGGNVQITGGFNYEEADSLKRILKTGVLPVELTVESSQEIGASSGQDQIDRGLKAVIIGLIAVFVFMLIYYKGAGLVADIAMALNFVIIAAILSAFKLTLSLSSIAGLVLTIGMSVDANVIIFERIKEEYMLGKSARASVAAGFSKATWTILDANITTFIAAFVLSSLGSGPIQGFAYTLAVGIVSSMFSALFVSKLMLDIGVEGFKMKKLSITWKRRKV